MYLEGLFLSFGMKNLGYSRLLGNRVAPFPTPRCSKKNPSSHPRLRSTKTFKEMLIYLYDPMCTKIE